MSLLQNSNAISTGVTGYNLESSLRFRRSASAYLSRTPTTAGNQKTWTWSGWIKRGNLSSSQFIFEAGTTQNETNILLFTTQGKILFRTVVASIEVTNLNTTAVYRDSSAWYHIIVAVDTTQATSSNRIKLYVNGSQVTTFDTATYQSQNSNTYVNSTVSHAMGRRPYQDSGHFDGYMTEVNFVDGQALTPSDFGEYDENTGVWKPKEYTGTYGTNGFHLPFTEAQASGFTDHFTDLTGGQNVQVADNALIEPGSGNFCLEFWCRPDTLNGVQENYICKGSSGYASYIIGRYSGTSGDGTLTMYGSSSGSSWDVFNNEVFGTVSAGSWHHLAFYRIGNNFYGAVNGNVRFIKTYSGAIWNNGNNLFIGTDGGGGSQSDIDVSNFRFVKGNSVYGTSNFTPPTAPLTAITGTGVLTLQDSTFIDNSGNGLSITTNGSPTLTSGTVGNYVTIGDDNSGNGNNWIANNMNVTTSTATTYDVMNDVPTLTDEGTANFATLNPIYLDSVSTTLPTFSNANLNMLSGATYTISISSIGINSGKYYFEYTMTAIPSSVTLYGGVSASPITSSTIRAYRYDTGTYFNGGTWSSYGATYTTGDTIGVALDMDSDTIEFYKNGSSQGQQTSIGLSGKTVYPIFYANPSGGFAVNFGQRPFAYTPPTGYKKLNTYNLPDSAVPDGSQYFDVLLYTGNGGTQTITGLDFQPDIVWGKARSSSISHNIFDTVRGGTKQLDIDTTDAEVSRSGNAVLFNSNGITLDATYCNINNTSVTNVAWNWRGSDSTAVTNTDGTITSTVSANTTAGCSVLTYTGNGTNGATIGHGLGSAPEWVIVKRRDSSGDDWLHYHKSLGATQSIAFDTAGAITSSTRWNNTTPSSSVITLGTSTGVNGSGATYVAYCFSEVEGFSKFGSYTGNGSTDGTFVYTGFRPAWIMTKNSSSGGEWEIYDTSRGSYNAVTTTSEANSSTSELNYYTIDILSNGFKQRNSYNTQNQSGATFIYMAFAENPYKHSLAR